MCAAVCRVLSGRAGNEFIKLNSTVDDRAQEIIQHRSVHLGVDLGMMKTVGDLQGGLEEAERLAGYRRTVSSGDVES